MIGLSTVAALALAQAASPSPTLESRLETVSISTGERRVVYTTHDHIEAPNWSRDGTINVPSWAPNSQAFAFVSYHPVKP